MNLKKFVCIVGPRLAAAIAAKGTTQRDVANAYTELRQARPEDFPHARKSLGDADISHFLSAPVGGEKSVANADTVAILALVLDAAPASFTVPKPPKPGAAAIMTAPLPLGKPTESPDEHTIRTDQPLSSQLEKEKSTARIIGLQAEQDSLLLPYISVPARASFISMGGDLSSFPPQESRRIYLRGKPLSMYHGRVVFEVDGDSMEPRINSGDEVIAVEIPEGKWDVQQNGIYVVAYDDVVTIKKIVNNDLLSTRTLTLRPWRDELAPFVVRRGEIRSMFLVELVMPRPYKPTL